MYVIFEKRFPYTWPSRARTVYPVGYRGQVKREVAEAAIAAKAAVKGSAADEGPEREERLPGNLDPALAEPDALTPNRHVADEEKSG